MSNEYPTSKELARLRKWPHNDQIGWLEFARSLWCWPDWGWETPPKFGRILHVSTGGWSGNEEIIAAMRHNVILWSQTWRLHRAGGHYEFKAEKTK